MIIRSLHVSDYHKGFLELLQQLTDTPYVPFDIFHVQCILLNKTPHILTFVADIGDTIIGTIRIILEPKFTHNCLNVGHIEDFVVHRDYRRKGCGYKLLQHAINVCKEQCCYKIILNCNEEMEPYYTKNGFTHKNAEMSLYM